MHRFVHIAASCVLTAALVLGVSPLASFGLQAASAADTPQESDTTAQDEQTGPATYAAEALEEGDTFVFGDLVYTVTATGEHPEAMLGDYAHHTDDNFFDTGAASAPTDSFTGGDVVLPDTVAYEGVNYTVTEVDQYAFYEVTSITSLTIPASITTIGDYAFSGCSKVATLTLNEGLTTVGSYGLALGTADGSSTLTELTVPASVQTIGTGGFAYLRYLEKLALTDTEENPSQLTSIGSLAFSGPSRSALFYNNVLTEVRIPASVTSISSSIFAYDTAITTAIFECDTTDMKYQSNSTSSSAATAWFYQLSVTDATAVLFTKGSAPQYWDSSIPGYMLVDFYPSEDDAISETDALGRAAVSYGTSSAQMAEDPESVTVYDADTYGTVPSIPSGYTLWQYRDIDEYLTITAAGALYPADVQINDLQYATVTREVDGTESPIPSAFDYDDFDADALVASLKVVDLLGNTLAAGTDYEASIEQEAAIGPATLTVTGIGDYSGAYVHGFTIELSTFEAADEEGHTFTYKVVKQPTATTPGTANLGDGDEAAYANSDSSIRSLDLPESVTVTLGEETYTCGVAGIAANAMNGCTSLRSLTTPDSVTSIGDKAFYGCSSLASLDFAEGLQTIGDYSFSGCTSLESVTFPNSLTMLGATATADYIRGSFAFNGCSSLSKVAFGTLDGGGACTIATRVFSDCPSLTEIALNGNVTVLSHSAFYELDSLQTITGLDGVSSIGIYAFYDCSALAYIDGEEQGVLPLVHAVVIRPLSFSGCKSLKTLYLGADVTFDNSGFTSGRGGSSGGYAFSETGITTVEFVGDWYTIPYGLLADCTKLKSVTLPDTVTRIEEGAFYGCSALGSISLPAGLASLGSSAFGDCTSLAEVVFEGSGVDLTIGSQAFEGCEALKSIVIPEGVAELPSQCFAGCTSLEEVGVPSTLESIGTSCFGPHTSLSYDYSACSSLKTINVSASVTSIGASAFDGCSALTGPLDLSGVDYLDEYTFRGCASLDDVTVARELTIQVEAFYGCESLTTLSTDTTKPGVVLPEGITGLGNRAFYGCSSIESLTVPAAVTSLPQSAFSGCSSLTELTLSEGVESLGQESFADCSSLATLATPASLTEIGTSAFSGCGKLTDLRLSEGLASIGRQAFAGCSSLPYVVLPATITSIATGAFSNCYDLDAVDCTAVDVDVADIAADAFTTGNTDTCLVFVQTDAPKGLVLDNGHVLTVTCPETVTYTGSELTPVVLACTDGADPEDFCWVTYTDNLIPGTASATVYVGAYEIPFSFEIENDGTYDPDKQPGTKQPITAGMVSDIPVQYYTGKAVRPAVHVGSYRQGVDYTVSYADNVNIGTAKATVTPSAEIGGTPVTKTFKITVKKNAAYKVGSVTYRIAKAKTDGKGSVTLAKCKKGKNVTVPAKVKIGGVSFKVAEIAAKAFKGAKKLKNIQIASSVKKIGKKAFFGCKKLSVVLFTGKKLPKLGKQAFAKTSSKVTVGVKSKPAKAEKKLRRAGLSKKALVGRG